MATLPTYEPASPLQPLTDEELEALDALLADLPGDAVMNVEALDGYLTAWLSGPVPLPQTSGETWLPVIWGGGDPFSSGKQRKRLVMSILRHLRHLDEQLRHHPTRWEPVFSMAEDADGAEWLDAQDWCMGFLCAMEIAPEPWRPWLDDPQRREHLDPILTLGGGLALVEIDATRASEALHGTDPGAGTSDVGPTAEATSFQDDLAQRDALSRRIPDAVLSLRG